MASQGCLGRMSRSCSGLAFEVDGARLRWRTRTRQAQALGHQLGRQPSASGGQFDDGRQERDRAVDEAVVGVGGARAAQLRGQLPAVVASDRPRAGTPRRAPPTGVRGRTARPGRAARRRDRRSTGSGPPSSPSPSWSSVAIEIATSSWWVSPTGAGCRGASSTAGSARSAASTAAEHDAEHIADQIGRRSNAPSRVIQRTVRCHRIRASKESSRIPVDRERNDPVSGRRDTQSVGKSGEQRRPDHDLAGSA